MAKNKIDDEKVREVRRLISLNEDSRKYFYEKADETWLEWLWKNGFFDVLKKKAEDPSRYSFGMPELRYIARMVELKPEIVTDIILGIPISNETFNPELIAQFLSICGRLPGTQLSKLTGKIKTEKWTALMQMYNQWGMDYGKMFESLKKSGHQEELMELASAVLSFRDDWGTKEQPSDITPFCLTHLSYSQVFYYLSNIEENNIEDAIDLSLAVLKKLTTLFEEDQETVSVFRKKDSFPLYDVDVFTIGLRSEYHGSGRDDVREVVALTKSLTERILTKKCNESAKEIFEKKFESLPDSWLMWRIRLFVLSLCSSDLMPHLKEALFRIFKEDHYSELIGGAEYKKALKKAFPVMGKDDQTRFVNMAKSLFSHDSEEERMSSEKWIGSDIFSVIGEYLSDVQVAELGNAGFEIEPGYVPTPVFVIGEFRAVKAKGPIGLEEFQSIPISTIVENLKGIWTPAQLVEQDTERNFHNPLNAEGMGKLLIEDVKTRLPEYLENAHEFLDRENLDLHYSYSLLSGFVGALDGNAEALKEEDWERLVAFCLQIIQSGIAQPTNQLKYENNEHDTWLGRWNAVCAEMANLLIKVLGADGKNLGFEWLSYRLNILSVIGYLFDYPDPIIEDEEIDSAKSTVSVGGQQAQVSDPFNMAINSIRGKAFKLFLLAAEWDREGNDEFESVGLSADIKRLYEYLLTKEDTRAIMFMFGHYLPIFFFRDTNWLKSMLNKIFPTDIGKEYLYLAAWEGFLANNLYLEMFEHEEFQSLYMRAIVMTVKDYPQQRHYKDPDEGLAEHFALAYIDMNMDFGFGNELFDYFWTDGILGQHIAFVDKIGRGGISSENPRTLKLISEDENIGRKLKYMWSWLLDSYPDPSVFEGIGFWINLDKGIFHANELASYLAKTLAKTNGFLQWDIGLQENIIELAKAAPEDTVEIIRLYLLEGGIRKGNNSLYFVLDEKWVGAFRILYTQPVTNQATISLINDLIREGGSFFWPLKGVLEG